MVTEETLCCVICHLVHVPRDLLHGEIRAKNVSKSSGAFKLDRGDRYSLTHVAIMFDWPKRESSIANFSRLLEPVFAKAGMRFLCPAL